MSDNTPRRGARTRQEHPARRRARAGTSGQSKRVKSKEASAFYRFLLDREFYGLPLDAETSRRRA